MTVNLENCNEIIAEFMGVKPLSQTYKNLGGKDYSESLDSLVPAWEKYNLVPSYDKMGDYWSCEMLQGSTLGKSYENGISKKIEEATAIATAKAIQELNNGK